jgi:hypothetical protein
MFLQCWEVQERPRGGCTVVTCQECKNIPTEVCNSVAYPKCITISEETCQEAKRLSFHLLTQLLPRLLHCPELLHPQVPPAGAHHLLRGDPPPEVLEGPFQCYFSSKTKISQSRFRLGSLRLREVYRALHLPDLSQVHPASHVHRQVHLRRVQVSLVRTISLQIKLMLPNACRFSPFSKGKLNRHSFIF